MKENENEIKAEEKSLSEENLQPEEKQTKKTKHKPIFYIVAIVLGVLLFLSGMFIGGSYSCKSSKANEIIRLIDKYSAYTDENVSGDDIARAVVKSVLKDDKYAKYYSKEEFETLQSEEKGEYDGVGLSFLVDSTTGETLGDTICGVYDNSPAFNAGIKKGDKVVYVCKTGEEKQPISNNNDLTTFLKNVETGIQISLYINRDGEFTEKEFTLVKGKYTLAYVKYYDSEMSARFYSEGGEKTKLTTDTNGKSKLASNTALISLSLFEGDAAREFCEALELMKKNNKSKLILDLRDNGGGFMTVLSDISSYLIGGVKGKSKIAVAKEKGGKEEWFYSSGNNFYKNITEIVVLANENTASASECLIGALLYYGKEENGAKFSTDNLVLTYNKSRENYSTYGKGIMQTTYKLQSGGAFKMTTAYIYQPDGETCIHDVGITTSVEENKVENDKAIARAVEILK